MFWVENLSGTQIDTIPNKSLKSITDFEAVVGGVSPGWLYLPDCTYLWTYCIDRYLNKYFFEHLEIKRVWIFNQVTVQDIQLLVEALRFEEDNMTACVGITAPEPPPGMKWSIRLVTLCVVN